ncbi:MAG TPA: HIT family protein [Phenylobacterium sp.]|nr:HIT family protein [Phenylobacterium sp.]
MSNQTAVNFGFPRTMVAETSHWLVLVRPKQPTFGSLILVCKEPVQAFSDVSPAAFADLQVAVGGIERLLRPNVNYEKINYLMLMMVDPDVHFHVIPRYDGVRDYDGQAFPDAGWPGVPALAQAVALSPAQIAALVAAWRAAWRAA